MARRERAAAWNYLDNAGPEIEKVTRGLMVPAALGEGIRKNFDAAANTKRVENLDGLEVSEGVKYMSDIFVARPDLPVVNSGQE